MGTSRSSRWTVTALLFSGRPDPTWEVSAETAARLVRLWDGLGPGPQAPVPPALGYRGIRLVDPSGTVWQAYGGAVTRIGNGKDHRSDPEGRWERMLKETAPPEVAFPDDLSDWGADG